MDICLETAHVLMTDVLCSTRVTMINIVVLIYNYTIIILNTKKKNNNNIFDNMPTVTIIVLVYEHFHI